RTRMAARPAVLPAHRNAGGIAADLGRAAVLIAGAAEATEPVLAVETRGTAEPVAAGFPGIRMAAVGAVVPQADRLPGETGDRRVHTGAVLAYLGRRIAVLIADAAGDTEPVVAVVPRRTAVPVTAALPGGRITAV